MSPAKSPSRSHDDLGSWLSSLGVYLCEKLFGGAGEWPGFEAALGIAGLPAVSFDSRIITDILVTLLRQAPEAKNETPATPKANLNLEASPSRFSNATTLSPNYSGLILSPKAANEPMPSEEDGKPQPKADSKCPRSIPARTRVKKRPSDATSSKRKTPKAKIQKRPAAAVNLKKKPAANKNTTTNEKRGNNVKMDYNNIYSRMYHKVRKNGGSKEEAWPHVLQSPKSTFCEPIFMENSGFYFEPMCLGNLAGSARGPAGGQAPLGDGAVSAIAPRDRI